MRFPSYLNYRRSRRARVSTAVFAITTIVSWVILLVWIESHYVSLMGHGGLAYITSVANFIFLASAFLLSCALMIVAMMLPGLIPVIKQFRRRIVGIFDRSFLSPYIVFGHLTVWIVFGISIFVFDFGIHRISQSYLVERNTWIYGACALAIAGTYELTPYKKCYIIDCCYPADHVRRKWHDGSGRKGAFRLGVSYGKTTIGCNWALMLLMFAIGMGNLLWMLFFGINMATERLLLRSAARVLPGAFFIGIASFLIIINMVF